MPLPPPGIDVRRVDNSLHAPRAAFTVLVADPHCVVREGIKALVNGQPDLRSVGEAADGPTAVALSSQLGPDVVLLEASLPGLDGAQVVARMMEAGAERKVMVLTGCEHGGLMRLLLGMGVRGYVLKRSPAELLLQALRAVAGGGTFIDPEMAGAVAGDPLGAHEPAGVALSEREVQVVRLIALGYSNKEIAARLRLSVKTVETYKTRSMEKLDLRGRVDIVRLAIRSGWLTEDAPERLVVSALPVS